MTSPTASPDAPPAQEPVFFSDARKENGSLSSMYLSPFSDGGVEYNCSEQFFQAAKADFFKDKETHANIMQTVEPWAQKNYGGEVRNFDLVEWKKHAYAVLLKATYLKFTKSQHAKELYDSLMATKDREIVHELKHVYWEPEVPWVKAVAERGEWPGENLLGKVLMEIRGRLREERAGEDSQGNVTQTKLEAETSGKGCADGANELISDMEEKEIFDFKRQPVRKKRR